MREKRLRFQILTGPLECKIHEARNCQICFLLCTFRVLHTFEKPFTQTSEKQAVEALVLCDSRLSCHLCLRHSLSEHQSSSLLLMHLGKQLMSAQWLESLPPTEEMQGSFRLLIPAWPSSCDHVKSQPADGRILCAFPSLHRSFK